jgi:hypothetical protein
MFNALAFSQQVCGIVAYTENAQFRGILRWVGIRVKPDPLRLDLTRMLKYLR